MVEEMDGGNSLEEARAKVKANQAAKAAKENAIAQHTVQEGETLSDIALKYYGHAGPTYYTAIYEANKDVIGDDMNKIEPGQELAIPAKPEVSE